MYACKMLAITNTVRDNLRVEINGKQILQELSKYLNGKFGKGFSTTNLKQMRQFYTVYSQDQISQTLSDQFANLPAVSAGRKFYLSWSHYLKLMRIDNIDERLALSTNKGN